MHKASTSGMKRHKCKIEKNVAPATPVVSRDDKDRVRDKCVDMCAKDLRPFATVGGEGFKDLAQELINIGVKYGPLEAKDVLPHPSTVARSLRERANQIRATLIPKLKEAIATKELSMTMDLWTDNYRKVHYMTATSSHIIEEDGEWKLQANVLITTKFPDVSKTGANIKEELLGQLAEIGISSEDLFKVTFVTDQGSNIKKALQMYDRLPCLAHCLNTVLRHTFHEENFLKTEVPQVYAAIQTVRKIVGLMKRSGLVSRLERTLHQDVDTRWSSIYTMLNSIHKQQDGVLQLLRDSERVDLANNYNADLVAEMIAFLKPFKEATDDLEGEAEPTLPLAVPWIFSLRSHCGVSVDDSEVRLQFSPFVHSTIYLRLNSNE